MKNLYSKIRRQCRSIVCDLEGENLKRYQKIIRFCNYKLTEDRSFQKTETKVFWKNGRIYRIGKPKKTEKVLARNFKEFCILLDSDLNKEIRVFL